MSIVYGVRPEGFVGKPLAVVESELDTGLKTILGDSAGTEPDGSIPLRSKAGQLKSLLTDAFSEQWDLQQAVYSSFNPAANSGQGQDQICAITGTVREPAKFSSVTATCTGTVGTVLLIGRDATVTDTNARFSSAADATIAAADAWAGTTAYALGARVSNGGNIYRVTVAGTSAGSGGPTGTGTDIVDGTVTWDFVGGGAGFVDVLFEADVAGPIGASAGQLATIATPVSGWTAITNAEDATVGANIESDTALRIRRDFEVQLSGNATADAIRAAILAVNEASQDPLHTAPTSVTVLYNDEDLPDANGVPAHSVEVIVEGGTDQDIANEIWKSVAAGIRTYGNQTSTVTDSQGKPQTVRWTRPDPINIYISATVWYDPTKWPTIGAAALIEQGAISAILTFADAYPPGFTVRVAPLSATLFDGPSSIGDDGLAVFPAPAGSVPMPGILDAAPFAISTAPDPMDTFPIPINVRQIAKFDSGRITITATPEAP